MGEGKRIWPMSVGNGIETREFKKTNSIEIKYILIGLAIRCISLLKTWYLMKNG